MKSHAELLAEIEENRLKNKELEPKINELSLSVSDEPCGYDPYDNPSLGKEIPDGADITERRRRILLRSRKG